CCAWLTPKEFIWQQSDNPQDWHAMDEDSSGPSRAGGSGMDDSRVCVCLAGSLCRQTLAPSSAFVSYAVVVMGSAHTPHSLDRPADPSFQQTSWPTSPSAYSSEPRGRVRLCLSPRGASRHVWDC